MSQRRGFGQSSEGMLLLGSMLREGNPRAIIALDRILLRDDEQAIREKIVEHIHTYGQVPTRQTLRTDYSLSLPDDSQCPEPSSYYTAQCRLRYAHQHSTAHFSTLRTLLENANLASMRQAEGVAVDLLSSLRSASVGGESTTIDVQRGMQMVEARIRERQFAASHLQGIPSYWPELDAQTGGWMPEDLNFILARPELGKSWILFANAHAAIESGYRVLIIGTELSVEATYRRMAALSLGRDPSMFKHGRINTNDLEILRQIARDYAERGLLYVEQLGLRNGGTAGLMRAVDRIDPDLICIDGVYLLPANLRSSGGRGYQTSRNDAAASTFEEVKMVAADTHKPILATSQFNRQSGRGGTQGSLETAGMSDTVGQLGSVILGLTYTDAAADRMSSTRRINILKGREGEAGSWITHYRFANGPDFRVMSEEELSYMGGAEEMGR